MAPRSRHKRTKRAARHAAPVPSAAKNLVSVDPATGERFDCGQIADKRQVGPITVWLTYDGQIWWIVWTDDGLRKAGYREARREDCWRAFYEMTEEMLAQLKQETSTSLPS